ncbi:hypothetical protein CCAX7_50380 [Capsulimonas corticalis]|uniref:Uncharacterized protein n=2 Tax=Capsulimonas corticalis TaxID=2219043 RepID=A0A402CPM9_9BACT|nr:hypothetical protein CCAX7_50380 [Capsulimonas corticalis]
MAVVPRAGAQDLALHADLGVGGKYRAGSWIPVTVTALNHGDQNYHGQIQVFADSLSAQGQSPSLDRPTEVFAVPASIPPSQNTPQRFQVYTRDLDPTRDNFTVQFAEGDRGEGRIAAKIVTTANYHVRPFSGTAIPAGDLFVVGVGSDPVGASFLSGLRLGLRHTPAGVQPALKLDANSQQAVGPGAGQLHTPTVQAVAAQPGDLPDSAAGYRGVDAVLLGADAALDSLSDAQIQALQMWTLSGGRLVVYGAGSGGAVPAALQQFLPARFAGDAVPISLPSGPGVATRMIPTGAAGVEIRQKAPDGTPLMLSGRYGAGSVLMIAYDPTSAPFRAWTGPAQLSFWRSVVTGGSALLPYAMQTEERGSPRFYGFGYRSRISDIVLHVPQLNAPGVLTVAIFLGLYIIILVPLNYFVLKKIDRREWAWITIPVLVLVVSAGAYGVAYAAKGGSLFVNRATIVETSAGTSQAAAFSGCGLFSSHRTTYDLDLSNPTAIAADSAPIHTYNRSWGGATASSFDGVRYVSSGSGSAVRGFGVNMWSMRTFDVQSLVDLGGTIDSSLKNNSQTNMCAGSITNHTSYALDNCALYWNGSWITLGDLAPGGSAAVTGNENPITGGFDVFPFDGRYHAPSPKANADRVHSTAGMKHALAAFAKSLGRESSESYEYYGVDPEGVRKPFSAATGEALLVGWSTDSHIAGPPLKVDGQTPAQDDVTLVVVHIPVR